MVDFDFVDFEELEKLRENQKEKSAYEYAQLQIPLPEIADYEPKEEEIKSTVIEILF